MRRMRFERFSPFFISVLGASATLGAALTSCSSADDPGSRGNAARGGSGGKGSGGSDNGTTGGTGGAGGGATGGTGGTGGSGGGVIDPGKGGKDAGPMTCGGDKYQAEKRPLDIYVMFDDSGSMIPWWASATQAFTQFINAPESTGIGVGHPVLRHELRRRHLCDAESPYRRPSRQRAANHRRVSDLALRIDADRPRHARSHPARA